LLVYDGPSERKKDLQLRSTRTKYPKYTDKKTGTVADTTVEARLSLRTASSECHRQLY
jgi:hypothetical protein